MGGCKPLVAGAPDASRVSVSLRSSSVSSARESVSRRGSASSIASSVEEEEKDLVELGDASRSRAYGLKDNARHVM